MIKKNWPLLYSIIVFIADIILFNFSFVAALYLRYPNIESPLLYLEPWIMLNILFFPFTIGLGVYRNIFQISPKVQAHNLKRFTFYLALTAMSYLFITKGHEYSRGVIIIFLLAQYFLLDIAHIVFYRLNKLLLNKGFGKRPVIIIGTDEAARIFVQKLKMYYGLYYHKIGYLRNGSSLHEDKEIEHLIIGDISEIDEIIKKYDIQQVFIVSQSMSLKKYENVRLICEKNNISVKMVSPIIYDLMNNAKVSDVTGVPLSTIKGRYIFEKWQAFYKRSLDLISLLVLSVFLIPFSIIISLIIKLTSHGPVLFKQERALFKGGRPFLFYKFRTMYDNSDALKHKLLSKNESNGALFKLKHDPRITPFGGFLRKYSLDEIPQFLNVLKGDMSIVGPRPLPLKDFEMIKNGKMNYDWYEKRGETKPGITGLWQISGRSELTFEEMCLLDLYYIENKSIFLDLEIMFETIPVVLFGRGAY